MRQGWLGVVVLVLAGAAQAAGFDARPAVPAPQLKAQDLAGTERTLADYRGKVVLLNFWASWCPPCLREMPSMERLRARMAGRPLVVVALDSAETPQEVNAYLSRMSLGFPVLLDPDGSNTKRWKVFVLPTSFLLDAEGRVRYVLTGPTEWDEGEALQVIESLLAESPPDAR
ncbi:MAG: TlpA disulfide reductase family protein [Thiobacillus sp.]|jgi:thiol-disulfide isomerase/thioredoxin|uniref:TlpA family protein disulfide reductase n=1 Tax=Thiobacillus sp. TaxID=924 RepID=UPI002893C0F9|nr:TlpA disulfide reductase family protein [Thiobacillus sp.]MDT3708015.1 TlpA disulfide reductase family protein [Thiobacillus sp.]